MKMSVNALKYLLLWREREREIERVDKLTHTVAVILLFCSSKLSCFNTCSSLSSFFFWVFVLLDKPALSDFRASSFFPVLQ